MDEVISNLVGLERELQYNIDVLDRIGSATSESGRFHIKFVTVNALHNIADGRISNDLIKSNIISIYGSFTEVNDRLYFVNEHFFEEDDEYRREFQYTVEALQKNKLKQLSVEPALEHVNIYRKCLDTTRNFYSCRECPSTDISKSCSHKNDLILLYLVYIHVAP